MSDIQIIASGLTSLFVLIILMGFMVFFYLKKKIWIIILIIFLFSLIFGVMALGERDIPFTPYLQIFFLLFQSIFFTLTSIDQWGGGG